MPDFSKARACLDYSFHKRYPLDRQLLQDAIVQNNLNNKPIFSLPSMFLTAGAMGSGKTHVLKHLLGNSFDSYVLADVDRIRSQLPENKHLIKTDPSTAGKILHSESCTIHEILFRMAIEEKHNLIIDGSLRNGDFFKDLIIYWRKTTPYKITIVHVKASLETCLRRAKKREKITGRYVPEESIMKSIEQCPKSVELLKPLVHDVITIDNDVDE